MPPRRGARPLSLVQAGGFIEDSVALREAGVELRGNEDVTLGRLFKQARCGPDA